MDIAILGGRFDPPHIWHFWIAKQVLENVDRIDQVWFVPDYRSALRKIYATPESRAEMLEFMQTDKILLSTVAFESKKTTYAVEILEKLRSTTYHNYCLLIGSDLVGELNKWYNYQELKQKANFLIYPRGKYLITNLPDNFELVSGNLLKSNLSSTFIRNRIKRGRSIKGLVFPEVEEYIKKRNLYR